MRTSRGKGWETGTIPLAYPIRQEWFWEALTQCPRLGARRAATPMGTRLESRLAVGGMPAVVRLVGRLAAQPRVRTTGIVPVRNGRKLPLEGIASVGHQQQASEKAFHRQDESLDDGDTAVCPYGAITRPLDPLAAAPGTEARAIELTAAVTDCRIGGHNTSYGKAGKTAACDWTSRK